MLPNQKATYTAHAVSVSFGVSSKGNYQIGVTLAVDDEHVGGSSIAWIGHFTEKTQDRTIESLQHMGWKGDDLTELEDLDADRARELLPDQVEIVCEPEEYEGNVTLKVKWVNKPGAGRFAFKDKLTGSTLKSFAQQMRGTIRSTQGAQRSTGSRSAPAKHPNAPGNKDNVPF